MTAPSHMRRALFSAGLALCALTLLSAASARADASADPPACPAPHVDWAYEPATFTAWATLPVSGCPARESEQFPLWLSITRSDPTSIHGADSGTTCGPVPSSSESDAAAVTCDIERTIDHPEVEQAAYEVVVTYPDADSTETLEVDLTCTTGEAGTSCVEAHGPGGEA